MGVTGLFLSPPVNIFLIMFLTETKIPENYGILEDDLIYYNWFSVTMLFFTLAMDVFLLNAQELVHGWKVYDYVSYQKYRFSVRDHRWMMNSKVLDESIAESLQTVDLLCFSSQYYFVVALYSLGSTVSMFGITIFLRAAYNPFGDPVMPMILFLMFVFSDMLSKFLYWLADVPGSKLHPMYCFKKLGWRGLWVTKQIEGTVDDDVAAKLAIGEGRQADLEQERLELQALNSERFRHRFLERNRPWILQHLVELLTPRSLESIGPDGRPVVEYIRDVYADLMAMGEGARRPGDRSDISSDEEDELEKARQDWSRAPVQGASLEIARLWLEKARKRRAFSKLITGIIEANKDDHCHITGRTEMMGAKLVVPLATHKEVDEKAIDRLSAEFESTLAEGEDAPWKAFPRARRVHHSRRAHPRPARARASAQAGEAPGRAARRVRKTSRRTRATTRRSSTRWSSCARPPRAA